MPGAEATLPPAFSLLNSEFNDFLFAPIGEESNNTVLTVLSALARLGIDPWQESARLAQLSVEKATQRLTSIISGLPNGSWAQSDAGAIAARLVKFLPRKRASESPSRGTARLSRPVSVRIVMVLAAAVLGGLIFASFSKLQNPPPAANAPVPTTNSPSAPFADSTGMPMNNATRPK
jgi:hypothetical protein